MFLGGGWLFVYGGQFALYFYFLELGTCKNKRT